MESIKNIAIIGSGNVAGFLAQNLSSRQFKIAQIISRNADTGQKLSQLVNATYSTSYALNNDIDLVVICVPDNQIERCVKEIADTDAIVCHCAGSIHIDVLNRFKNNGVLYPLQSISEKLSSGEFEIPFLIEASADDILVQLKGLLDIMGYGNTVVSSKDRLNYHLAAVFTNNFTNAMVLAADQIIDSHHLNPELLKPLLFQTFERLKIVTAKVAQTGPARRNDLITIQKHLELLKNDTRLQEIYSNISDYITLKFRP